MKIVNSALIQHNEMCTFITHFDLYSQASVFVGSISSTVGYCSAQKYSRNAISGFREAEQTHTGRENVESSQNNTASLTCWCCCRKDYCYID